MMSHLQLLELSTDGPISSAAWSAAIASDQAATVHIARVRCRVKALKPAGIVWRMAEVMRRAAVKRGRCYRQDLAEAGFSTAEINAHAEDARALAARQAEAMGERREVEIPVAELLQRTKGEGGRVA
jgi:hypothetical protein